MQEKEESLSVELENIKDIQADLEKAFSAAK